MAIDHEATVCFGVGYERSEKYDWGPGHLGVIPDSCRYFAPVSLRHHDIQQDHVGPKNARRLMGFGRIVFRQHKIVTSLLQKELDKPGCVGVVINYEDTSRLIERRPAN